MNAKGDSPWQVDRNPLRPLRGSVRAGTVIVGAGIAGLQLARSLAERGDEVAIVEARHIGHGASGRNAGFLLADGATPYASLAARDGNEIAQAVRLLGTRSREIVAALDARAIGLRSCGSLRLACDADEADALRKTVGALGDPLRFVEAHELPAPWRDHSFFGAAEDPDDGVMNPMQLLCETWERARDAGAVLFERSPVRSIEASSRGVEVTTDAGTLSGERVVIATNAWARALRGLPIRPMRAQMLAARVDPTPAWPQPVYARGGADYWRVLDGEILIGGCRDAGGPAEACDEARPSTAVQSALDVLLRSLVPGGAVEITHRWAGLMGFTPDERPIAGPIDDTGRVHALAGFNGHGMGWAPALAEALAEQLTGGNRVHASFAAVRFDG